MAKNNGSGRAYVLPDNQAAGIFVNGLDAVAKKEELQRIAALKRQQELSDANSKTIGDIKLTDHWGARSAELQKDTNALVDYAIKATQDGANINADSNFRKMESQLTAKAGATKDLQALYDKAYTEVGKSPDAYENGIDVLRSIQGATLEDYTSGKFKPEQLRKIYSLTDAVKESGGTTAYTKNNDGTFDTTKVNRTGNVGQAIASLTTPSAKYLIQKAGGDTEGYLAGFPTVTPQGKTYYNTEGKQFEDAVIKTLATDPAFPEHLQRKGYDVSTTDAIRKSAFDYAKKQNAATGKYVKDYADVLENKATTDTTRIFTAEANARAARGEQRSIESHNLSMQKSAEEAFAKNPDSIATNVVTNLSTTQIGGKVITRPSTSFAAANVGNAKSSFLPTVIFDPETGGVKQNTSSIAVSGGQIHIKPLLRFGGTVKILDDESIKKLKAGTYKLNGKKVPKNANITYDEMLYGEERVFADPADITSKATVRKVIIPVTGQALDGKFEKGYNRERMYEAAAKSQTSFEEKKEVIKQYLKHEAPNLTPAQLDAMAFETAKQY